MTDPILLTPTEAARALGIGRSKLYELLQEGVLESVHIGRCRRIPSKYLTDFVRRLGDNAVQPSSPDGHETSRQAGGTGPGQARQR